MPLPLISVRRFGSAREPGHRPPAGVARIGFHDVGTDHGVVGVGGEQEGAVGKCKSRWANGCSKDGG